MATLLQLESIARLREGRFGGLLRLGGGSRRHGALSVDLGSLRQAPGGVEGAGARGACGLFAAFNYAVLARLSADAVRESCAAGTAVDFRRLRPPELADRRAFTALLAGARGVLDGAVGRSAWLDVPTVMRLGGCDVVVDVDVLARSPAVWPELELACSCLQHSVGSLRGACDRAAVPPLSLCATSHTALPVCCTCCRLENGRRVVLAADSLHSSHHAAQAILQLLAVWESDAPEELCGVVCCVFVDCGAC